MATQTTASRVRNAVTSRFEARRAKRTLAREIAAYRTPAERLELDLILGRHTAEETREIEAILRAQAVAERTSFQALQVDQT
ncbi:hypothetical protein Daura_15135 [Dactylosporangium aurantiacum]|uniref:Uncharacterized protein n=1 Tax=Dactylosporangium aurantiacum TaxID=35754 RepID=A0A9Q9MQA2_9ACTN|nr:hypothetical protein [Dactylosporangium aurantiacum]MDG6108435.1 hypothetical protein [Dactylosporangium aurantiacum]UWZ57372.1 hypothetical protein Daura_15135 [Dactylosporangium aurantiacum]